MTTSPLTWVYCVVHGQPPSFGKTVKRLPSGGPIRAVEIAGGYHAIVASVPEASYEATAIEGALSDMGWVGAVAEAHEGVVERAAERAVTVPMKLFTIFESDESAAKHVKAAKRRLDAVKKRIAGCDEWGLRVLFDETSSAEQAKATRARAATAKTGAEFLTRKKEAASAKQSAASSAKAASRKLGERLDGLAKASARRVAPNRELATRVLLDAVFLVSRASLEEFRDEVTRGAEQLMAGGAHVVLTGPWPAYSFVEDG